MYAHPHKLRLPPVRIFEGRAVSPMAGVTVSKCFVGIFRVDTHALSLSFFNNFSVSLKQRVVKHCMLHLGKNLVLYFLTLALFLKVQPKDVCIELCACGVQEVDRNRSSTIIYMFATFKTAVVIYIPPEVYIYTPE